MTYDIGNPGPDLRQAYNVVELNHLMGSQYIWHSHEYFYTKSFK